MRFEGGGRSESTSGPSKYEDTMLPSWFCPAGKSASTPVKQGATTQLKTSASSAHVAKNCTSFLDMMESCLQQMTSLGGLSESQKTRNRATFGEDKYLPDTDLDSLEDDIQSMNKRMNGASLDDRHHQKTNTNYEAQESRPQLESLD